jgi:hypothetical protein
MPTIFISIDIEGGNEGFRKRPVHEVGVAILIIPNLESSSLQTQSPIQSHNFCMPTEWGYPKSKRRFIFGDSEKISRNEFEDLLLRITQGWQPKLGRILDHFKTGEDVAQKWLHIAGNDANYTLRAVPLSLLLVSLIFSLEKIWYANEELKGLNKLRSGTYRM